MTDGPEQMSCGLSRPHKPHLWAYPILEPTPWLYCAGVHSGEAHDETTTKPDAPTDLPASIRVEALRAATRLVADRPEVDLLDLAEQLALWIAWGTRA